MDVVVVDYEELGSKYRLLFFRCLFCSAREEKMSCFGVFIHLPSRKIWLHGDHMLENVYKGLAVVTLMCFTSGILHLSMGISASRQMQDSQTLITRRVRRWFWRDNTVWESNLWWQWPSHFGAGIPCCCYFGVLTSGMSHSPMGFLLVSECKISRRES